MSSPCYFNAVFVWSRNSAVKPTNVGATRLLKLSRVNFSTVPVDILAGYVRQVRLITVPLGVEDEGFLARLHPAAEFAGAQEKTELERHVETGKPEPGSGSVFEMS